MPKLCERFLGTRQPLSPSLYSCNVLSLDTPSAAQSVRETRPPAASRHPHSFAAATAMPGAALAHGDQPDGGSVTHCCDEQLVFLRDCQFLDFEVRTSVLALCASSPSPTPPPASLHRGMGESVSEPSGKRVMPRAEWQRGAHRHPCSALPSGRSRPQRSAAASPGHLHCCKIVCGQYSSRLPSCAGRAHLLYSPCHGIASQQQWPVLIRLSASPRGYVRTRNLSHSSLSSPLARRSSDQPRGRFHGILPCMHACHCIGRHCWTL